MSYACPNCKSQDLRVEVLIVRDLVQIKDGVATDVCSGAEDHWDGKSLMLCAACDHRAPARDFEFKPLWQRLNELSYSFPYDSGAARLLGAAAAVLKELLPNETGPADAAPPGKR